MAYGIFARYYDALTQNVKYKSRAVYFNEIIQKYKPGKGILLDLACGTGSLSFEMAKLGYEVIGVDASADMLSIAMQKNTKEPRIMFLNQTMQGLDLYGTVDAAVCALDSINHLTADMLAKALDRLRPFLIPNGIFIFDVNTQYKHREVLADNCFVHEHDDVYCVWQNHLQKDDSVKITLDFFESDDSGSYTRHREELTEYLHEDEKLREMLKSAGFKVLAVLEADTQSTPGEKSERVVYVTAAD